MKILRAILLCLCVMLLTLRARAQTANLWEPPQVLGKGWWQSIAVDPALRVHVAWYGSSGEQERDILKYRQAQPDGTWSAVLDLFCPCDKGNTVRNALATSADGQLYALFRQKSWHQVAYVSAAAATDPRQWSTPVDLNHAAYYADLLVGNDGRLHAVYAEGVSRVAPKAGECGHCTDVLYRQSADGGQTWSAPVNLSNSAGEAVKLNVLQGASGTLYAFWDEYTHNDSNDGQPFAAMIVSSNDGGLTWSVPIALFGARTPQERPNELAFAELLDGSWLAVWRYARLEDEHIYAQRSSDGGQTWSAPAALPGWLARSFNVSKFDDYELLLDGEGRAHFFGVGIPKHDSKQETLYHSVFADETWSQPQIVFYASDRLPEWPQAALDAQGTLHLTWFVRLGQRPDQQYWLDQFEVYYSRLLHP